MKGINSERSGLWFQFKRLIKEIRPSYAIIENVANLRKHGLAQILKDLWALGYDAEWKVISAAEVGAYHRRDRIWIVAYANGERLQSNEKRVITNKKTFTRNHDGNIFIKSQTSDNDSVKRQAPVCIFDKVLLQKNNAFALDKPPFPGVDNGLSSRLDKNRVIALGNTVVPQIVEHIGRCVWLDYLEKKNQRKCR